MTGILQSWRAGRWRLRRRIARAARCLSPPALGHLLRRVTRPAARESLETAPWLRATPTATALYRLWIRRYEDPLRPTTGWTAEGGPSFLVVVTGGDRDPTGLERTLESVRSQAYQAREVHLATDGDHPEPVGDADALLHLAAGDRLAGNALAGFARGFSGKSDIELVFGDEDHLGADGGRCAPHFKPDWNPELFWSSGYLGAAVALRGSLVARVGDRRPIDSSEAWEELLHRCVAACPGDRIGHIARILVHRRSPAIRPKPDLAALSRRSRLVERLLTEEGRPIRTEVGRMPGTLRLSWPLPAAPPRATVVILTRNAWRLLDRCLRSVWATTRYPDYEILIVDHASDDPETLDRLSELRAAPGVSVLRREGTFNFSALNNHAVDRSASELLVFLNNDVELQTEGWLEEMASHALRRDVGAVGARLLYPDGRLQHGGILLGGGAPKDAVAGHLSHGIARDDPGYFGRAFVTQEVSAVTAACLALRRKVFDEVGGFDAQHLPVAFNDVDLCLKIGRTGRRIVWTPWAEAVHHESATRGDDLTGPSRRRFAREVRHMRRRWGALLDLDPCYNPNLDPVDCDFTLAFPPRRGR